MLTVAYLANQFPSRVEPYVAEEIEELKRRGVRVIAGSVRKAAGEGSSGTSNSRNKCSTDIVLQPLHTAVLLRALLLCLRRWNQISPLLGRIIFHGRENPLRRVKALLHT